jgi:DUF1680 family protein
MTGVPLYLRTIEIAWNDIVTKRLYVSGTTSSAEYFKDDNVLPGDQPASVGEGCATVTWLQLNWELLRLTGEAKYAEQLERTVYNALLAAQNPQNGDICYFTPLNGRKTATSRVSCCLSSEPRGISMIPQLAWGLRRGAPAVNFYVPGQAAFHSSYGEVTILSKTSYPAEGSIHLTIGTSGPKRFPLYLRVPDWTDRYVATVQGREYHGTPGQYLAIEREWKAGDQVEIDIDMTVRVVPGGRSYPSSVAIFRGPQLLALEQSFNKGVDPQAAGPRSMKPVLAEAQSKAPPVWHGVQKYILQAAGRDRELVLVPFADAQVYTVWLARP